jgi:kynurenine formamidase
MRSSARIHSHSLSQAFCDKPIDNNALRYVSIPHQIVDGSKEGLSHKILLSGCVGIIENLSSNLKNLSDKRVFLVCLPLLLEGVDGSPARIIAFDIV